MIPFVPNYTYTYSDDVPRFHFNCLIRYSIKDKKFYVYKSKIHN